MSIGEKYGAGIYMPDAKELERIREYYLKYKCAWYLFNNPNTPHSKVRKYARVAWARKLKKLNLNIYESQIS